MPLHKDLTGTDLHEPKGVASAAANTVYIADGAGSGAWTALDERLPAGTVSMYMGPVAPTGWLELAGQAILIASYPELYAAVTIQQTGTRSSGSAIITGLSSTTNMKVGYYVVGTGIASGTTILTVDSGTQITLSANASSSGTATVVVCPWLVSATELTLPDLYTLGLFPRSRTSSVRIGTTQTELIKNHVHPGSISSSGAHTHTGTVDSGGAHTHTVNITDPGHAHGGVYAEINVYTTGGGANNQTFSYVSRTAGNTSSATTGISAATVSGGAHTHTFSIASSGAHTHTFTTDNNTGGGSETRPANISLMFVVRT